MSLNPRKSNSLLQSFLDRWPIEVVEKMTLEEYNQIGNFDSFCYWIERKTKPLGGISGTNSYKFEIFQRGLGKQAPKSNQYLGDDLYNWRSRVGNTREEAFQNTHQRVLQIIKAAKEGNIEDIDNIIFTPITKWKIAFLYTPYENIIPIYDREILKLAAMEYGMANVYNAKISTINKFIAEKKPKDQDILEFGFNIFWKIKGKNKLQVEIFDKGDEEYFEWMKNNPDGFILNTGRKSNTSFFSLHKSNCTHITEYDSLDHNAYTAKDLIKIGANDTNELSKYCQRKKKKFQGDFKICKSCSPEYSKIDITYSDDLDGDEEKYLEGTKKTIIVNAYERNPKARQKCIEHFGCKCQCCGLEFKEKYGEIGEGFIHVHHLKSLSEIGEEYEIDPIKDLLPLCPNCHSMIHRRKIPYTLDELKTMMENI